MPCPFCTTSTVIASGTTSSTIACHENAGTYRFGRDELQPAAPAGSKRPSAATSDGADDERADQRRQEARRAAARR